MTTATAPTTSKPLPAAHRQFNVGPGPGQLASLDLVPWETLGPGDVVCIYWNKVPYKGKFAINGYGTAAKPILIQGIVGPRGQRPIIDGNGATTRRTCNYGRASASATNQGRNIVCIVTKDTDSGINQPTYIQIDGLSFQNCMPANTYHDEQGAVHNYASFGAAIWIDAGHNITISNCDVDSGPIAIYSKSIDGSLATITKDILISRINVSNVGIPGDDHEHGMYIQSVNPIIEYCHILSMNPGAGGNAFKDRSVGPVYRYNKVDCGTYAFDLVEAEDYPDYANSDPNYKKAYIYGNIIQKGGQLCIHYGGDNGAYRGGTLYCWDNTFVLNGDLPANTATYMFRISTTGETVECWNNIVYFNPATQYMCWRVKQDVPNNGGILNLGINWVNQGWLDTDPFHPVGGQLNGTQNLITGTTAPMNTVTLRPLSPGPVINVAQPQLPQVSGFPVSMQIDVNAVVSARPSVRNLGAIETP